MPIYEYQCQACGHELEALQKMSDAPLTECSECGKPELKKKISAAAFRLKGGGWYETDFKAGDKKKNLAGEAGGGKKAEDKGSASTSGDSKAGDKKAGAKPAAAASSS